MNTITIQGFEYNFAEKTYTVNKNMNFKVKLTRYIKNESVVCLCLLKSLVININNKVINFNPRKRVGTYGAKEFNKNLKLQHYLLYKENIDLINNVSRDVNNRCYYNFVVESDGAIAPSDSTIIPNEILLNDNKLNVAKLYETCIISPNKTITNFEYIPIFHRNGSEKKSETEVIVHFSILIDMLTKVFSEFKHLILKLSDIILNLTELKDEDLETYMNMTTSEYIKLLKEKDKNIS